ncbi:MAG: LysM domain-containing protein [Planctomycetota bacterium]|nr:LysM domain-containing protein [Planctomycetota bacterium]
MTSRLRLALFALVLLIVAAVVGIASGSRRSSPEEAKPVTPMLDVAGFRSVELLAPEQRKPWLDGSQFARPLAPDPRRGESAKPAPAHAGTDAGEALPAVAGTRQYRIRENDTMSKIARREYGDEKLAAWLLRVNRISDPTKLGIGDLIQLPPPPEPQAMASGGSLQPTPVTSGKTYVVRKNETLGEISQKVYGSARHADVLMKANGLKRPEDLRTGQTLTIPAL